LRRDLVLRVVVQLGQPEIEDLHHPVPAHEHVLGLQVAVDDAALVRGRETSRHLRRMVDGLPPGQVATVQVFAQRFPLEPLRDDVRHALMRAHVVHGQEVRVAEGSRGPRLLLEAAQAIRIGG
jgi:hypothetical protein